MTTIATKTDVNSTSTTHGVAVFMSTPSGNFGMFAEGFRHRTILEFLFHTSSRSEIEECSSRKSSSSLERDLIRSDFLNPLLKEEDLWV
jgi:hypothetical protein